MRRRILAAATGVLLAALWATPAFAQSTPEFLQAPGGGKVATGSQAIKVKSEPSSIPILGIGLEKVTIEVNVRPRSGTGGGLIPLGRQEGSIFEAMWNAGGAEYNGAYDIVAVATTPSDEQGKSATVSNVLVNNPPSAPTGVKAELRDGVPHVRWTASPEPDVIGYKVMRSIDGKDVQAYSGAATSFSDQSAPHSQAITYKVSAVRKSLVTQGGVESSKVSSGSITVPAPPPPAAEPGDPAPADPNNPTVPGTNIVTGKETPKAPAVTTNKNFGKAVAPIVKSAPAGTAFEPTLPYTGTPPENFAAASGGEVSPIDAALADEAEGVIVTNPVKFILGGLILLGVSFVLWRTSRKLLVGTRPEEQLSPHRVNFPEFRINRG